MTSGLGLGLGFGGGDPAVCLVSGDCLTLVVYAQVTYELYECPVWLGAGCDSSWEG